MAWLFCAVLGVEFCRILKLGGGVGSNGLGFGLLKLDLKVLSGASFKACICSS